MLGDDEQWEREIDEAIAKDAPSRKWIADLNKRNQETTRRSNAVSIMLAMATVLIAMIWGAVGVVAFVDLCLVVWGRLQ